MGSCMVEKFKNYLDLSKDEEKLLLQMEDKTEKYKSGEKIVKRHDTVKYIYVLKNGHCSISKNLDKEIRTIFDIKINGDVIGISELSYDKHLYDLNAITDVEICPFPRKNLIDIFDKSERLTQTFFSILSREQSILYERLASLGRRTAIESIANLIIEFYIRYNFLTCKDNKTKFSFPFNQQQLADLLGISKIHVSRSMTELRNNKYIQYDRNTLEILEFDKLINLANFDEYYLQKPNTNWNS